MKRAATILLAACGLAFLPSPTRSAPAASTAVEEGQALARELVRLKPAENTSINGILKIRDAHGRRTEIPVRLQVLTGSPAWQSIYETQSLNSNSVTRLTVTRTGEEEPRYQLLRPAPDGDKPPSVLRLTGDRANIAFADSDFWLADLGLEFLYWPGQKLLKKELRRSQSCNVLESVNPKPGAGGYARVISWIDIKTGGIVFAEAYDQKGRKLKEFKPDKFEKVNGHWQVKEIEIRNLQTGSRTRLEFESETP